MEGRACLLCLVLFACCFTYTAPVTPSTPTPPTTPSTQSTSTLPTTKTAVRLSRTLQPQRYEVHLRPHLSGDFRVEGKVEVQVTVHATTQYFILHMADIVTLNQTAKLVETGGGKDYRIVQQRYSPSKMLYVVVLEENLVKGGNYTFSVRFWGTLGLHPRGFYRSSYTKENGDTSWVASTQFQATEARRAFPCFDEPAMKARFKIYLARKEGMTALSNMPLMASTPINGEEGWVWDEFEESVPMSTYLVAFAISDYPIRVVREAGANSTLIRVATRAAALSQTQHSGVVATQVLSLFEQYFDLPYPLPKIDLFSPPENSFNAMENWGLITFRESGLLYTSNSSSLRQLQWTTYLVAHELAHQWFGNLVTLDWWTDLWLNEGFATFLAEVAVNQIEPSLGSLDQFVVRRQQSVMALDALRSSHPVSVPVHDPAAINEIFDVISYNKGASIIRMMSNFLTESTFRRGLKNYLSTLKYDNAEQDDLWRHLTEAAHEAGTLPRDLTVKTIMDTWTLQMGFPVVTVMRTSNTSGVVTQEYFVLDDAKFSSSTSSSTWWIPLTYTTGGSPDFSDTHVKLWLESDQESREWLVELPEPQSWVVFNVRQTGFYRVNYDEANWRLLAQQLKENHAVIHPTNRAQIIDDAFNLARSGRLSYDVALEMISYLAQERHYVPWNAAFSNFQYIYSMFHRNQAYGAIKDYILSLLQPLYESLGFEERPSDPFLTQLLRSDMLTWVCRLGHVQCRNKSLSLYRRWMADPHAFKGISPNMVETVGCTAVDAGGEAEWNFAWKRPELKESLGCTRELWLLTRYLDGSFNASSGIQRQDASYTFRRVAVQPLGAILAWDFMRAHWPRITQYIGTTFFALPKMVEDVTSSFNTPQQLQELEEFERQYRGQLLTAGMAVQQAMEAAKINIAWMENNRRFIVAWLARRGFTSDLAALKAGHVIRH